MNEHERVQNTVDEPERTPSDRRRFLLGLVAAGLAYVTPTLLGLDEAEAEPWKHSNRRRTRRTESGRAWMFSQCQRRSDGRVSSQESPSAREKSG